MFQLLRELKTNLYLTYLKLRYNINVNLNTIPEQTDKSSTC